MYDDLLGTYFGLKYASSSLVAFADDVAVIATRINIHTLEDTMDRALFAVSMWMEGNGLKLSVHKTESVVLTTKRGYTMSSFTLDGEAIKLKECLKYLGVELSRARGFRARLKAVASKASKAASAPARLLPNVGGSRHKKRRLRCLTQPQCRQNSWYMIEMWHTRRPSENDGIKG